MKTETAPSAQNTFEGPSPLERLNLLASTLHAVPETSKVVEEARAGLKSGEAPQFSAALSKLSTMEQIILTDRPDLNNILIRVNIGSENERITALKQLAKYGDLAASSFPELERLALRSEGDLKDALLRSMAKINPDGFEAQIKSPNHQHAEAVVNFIAVNTPGRVLELRLSEDPIIRAAANAVYEARRMRFGPDVIPSVAAASVPKPTSDDLNVLRDIATTRLPNSEVGVVATVFPITNNSYFGYIKCGGETLYFHSDISHKLQPEESAGGVGMVRQKEGRVPKPNEQVVFFRDEIGNVEKWAFGDRLTTIAGDPSRN